MAKSAEKGLREDKKHGSVLFPFNIYPCCIPEDFPSVALHWQEGMEVIYVKQGQGLVQIGMQPYHAEGGDIFVAPPGILHAIRGVGGGRMEYENFLFDLDFLGLGSADICAQKYLIPLAAGQLPLPGRVRPGEEGYPELSACLADAEFLCEQKEAGYELGVKAVMTRFLFLLLQGKAQPLLPQSATLQRLKMVLQRVEEEYAAPLTVEEMARSCGCSASHFMRWFKQMTGSSFGVYLNEKRLTMAAERLKAGSETVLDIAEEVGYENLSNFNRQFKARYGVTPRDYRKGKRPETPEKGQG